MPASCASENIKTRLIGVIAPSVVLSIIPTASAAAAVIISTSVLRSRSFARNACKA